MTTRFHWVLCAMMGLSGQVVAGCGGSSDDGGGTATDSGADGTTGDAKVDSSSTGDTTVADSHSGDALITDDTTTPPTDSGDAACSGCIGAKLVWGRQGGKVPSRDTSTLSPCRAYEHRRTFSAGGADKVCTQDLANCPAGDHDIAHVVTAIAQAKDELAKAPIFYGKDNRPTDGSVFIITYDGKELTVGDDCAGASGCTPPPATVAALVTLLQAVDTDQLALGTCKTTFGP